METAMPLSPVALLPAELEQLRPALADRYPDAQGVLGSQLGAFVRRHLTNPDLKGRFGGLKSFVAHNFPAEIVWRGRRGLDDLYDISFATTELGKDGGAWQPVSSEPSASLWSAVTNPTIFVRFAWSPKDESLMRAPAGLPLTEGFLAVDKLTKADYQTIAMAFVESLESIDASRRALALGNASSSVEFTRWVREQGLLAKWEEFRVHQALRLFADRLGASGATETVVTFWADVLQSSQRQARARRLQKSNALSTTRQRSVTYRENASDEVPDTRAVAIKAMEFLSDTELSQLHLPLGSIMSAFASLLKR